MMNVSTTEIHMLTIAIKTNIAHGFQDIENQNRKFRLFIYVCFYYRYARVLLHAIYLDQVDLSLISRGGCGGGLGEAQALAHTGRARPSPLEEAMELYQIGRFLELDILSQGCEDLILEWLSLETLSVVLQWSHQPHGSAWVHRQVKNII